MVIHWRADDGPFIAIWVLYPLTPKKTFIKFGPPLTKLSGSTHDMTLSSADNPFKQFGPRSGLTFCPELIGVQTVRHFRGYDKLKLNRCILTLRLNLYMTLTSADNPFKQVGPRSGSTFCPDLIGIQTV